MLRLNPKAEEKSKKDENPSIVELQRIAKILLRSAQPNPPSLANLKSTQTISRIHIT